MALKKLLCVSAMFVVISAPVVAAETVDDHGKPMHEQEHAPVAHGAIGAHEAVETHAGDLTVPPGRHPFS